MTEINPFIARPMLYYVTLTVPVAAS